ncbi:olfactory receptor 49-like [Hyla sarda]|uniref:olfactory receptor 49-like n=1 Tax=Hyla sarda TaxID=327740 RepID=UPI0024C32561|nr:olfactory receptor 49-like [Hyla sarda]
MERRLFVLLLHLKELNVSSVTNWNNMQEMDNISLTNSQVILMGILEIGNWRYLYSLGIILNTVPVLVLSSLILFVTYTEEALHQPMYIFISNLMFNEIYTTIFTSKLLIDVLSGRYTIPFVECLVQGFFMQSCPCVEMFTFTVMAYDRYLAIGHPLRYPMLMTNKTALRILLAIWVYVLVGIGICVMLTSRQTLCGVEINSMFCETISLNHLSCDGTYSVDFGFTWDFIMLVGCGFVVLYCYIRTFIVCFSISGDASRKALHTLVTHMIAFSTFFTSFVFPVFRYRYKGDAETVMSHILFSLPGALSFFLNPLIYGFRIEALRKKILQKLTREKREISDRGKKRKN